MKYALTEAFSEIAMLAARLGVKSVDDLSGCWEHQIDPRWWIAVNGKEAETRCSHGQTVPPFSAYVEFNGWPAGIINPYGGLLAASDAANEDTFITAIRDAAK